jgi:hypothetical protein
MGSYVSVSFGTECRILCATASYQIICIIWYGVQDVNTRLGYQDICRVPYEVQQELM